MKRIAAALAVASLIGAGNVALAENQAADTNKGVGTQMREGAVEMKEDTKDAMRNTRDAVTGDKVDARDNDADERPEAYPADNSGRNQRDKNDATPTAEDQSNNKQDVEITQNIRKSVTGDDSLSMNAHNVKIITNAGVVTLRGPVKSEQEKQKIAAKAKAVTGVARVDNQLEIEAE
jgi:hyperosmotically inducible periplasmic protein